MQKKKKIDVWICIYRPRLPPAPKTTPAWTRRHEIAANKAPSDHHPTHLDPSRGLSAGPGSKQRPPAPGPARVGSSPPLSPPVVLAVQAWWRQRNLFDRASSVGLCPGRGAEGTRRTRACDPAFDDIRPPLRQGSAARRPGGAEEGSSSGAFGIVWIRISSRSSPLRKGIRGKKSR